MKECPWRYASPLGGGYVVRWCNLEDGAEGLALGEASRWPWDGDVMLSERVASASPEWAKGTFNHYDEMTWASKEDAEAVLAAVNAALIAVHPSGSEYAEHLRAVQIAAQTWAQVTTKLPDDVIDQRRAVDEAFQNLYLALRRD